MTKKQYHQSINKEFYSYVETNFPEYQIDHSEGYGRIYLIPVNENGVDGVIEYHQSEHTLCCFNWSHQKTKNDIEKMTQFIENQIIPKVDKLFQNS
jgi:hypothetical protein